MGPGNIASDLFAGADAVRGHQHLEHRVSDAHLLSCRSVCFLTIHALRLTFVVIY